MSHPLQTKPYDVAEQLRTEEERRLFIEALIVEGTTAEELAQARECVERSRKIHPNRYEV